MFKDSLYSTTDNTKKHVVVYHRVDFLKVNNLHAAI